MSDTWNSLFSTGPVRKSIAAGEKLANSAESRLRLTGWVMLASAYYSWPKLHPRIFWALLHARRYAWVVADKYLDPLYVPLTPTQYDVVATILKALWPDESALDTAEFLYELGLRRAERLVTPHHDVALLLVGKAELMRRRRNGDYMSEVEKALSLYRVVFEENEPARAMRQWSRVLRRASILMAETRLRYGLLMWREALVIVKRPETRATGQELWLYAMWPRLYARRVAGLCRYALIELYRYIRNVFIG